ncbi:MULTISPECIES: hypothetical protein [unclassified Methylobacterium]|uniref:hypothetical protein n=1 Tax=unclassified Methylobacterium TaxID=2615210 RepID=UPI00226A43E9|nr:MULTISPECIES: hypothetical protein [unclassified Methylobacterium]
MFNPHHTVEQVTGTFETLAHGFAGVLATALANAREDRATEAANAAILRAATARLRAARLANLRLDAAAEKLASNRRVTDAELRDRVRRGRLRAA